MFTLPKYISNGISFVLWEVCAEKLSFNDMFALETLAAYLDLGPCASVMLNAVSALFIRLIFVCALQPVCYCCCISW